MSILITINPIASVISVVILVAFLLLIVGIKKALTGIFVKNRARFSNLGLGILVIILALIAMIFPVVTSIFLIYLLPLHYYLMVFQGLSTV
ncbi:MAG: DUF308 domain-containing protein [Nitrososphaeraceae archaeon]